MAFKNKRGFTLIEVVVVSAVIAILAGILTPIIFNQIDESKKAHALGDIKTMQTALIKFKADNSAWPNRTDGSDPTTNTVQALVSNGNAITSASDWPVADSAVSKNLFSYFGPANDRTYPAANWKGPYLPEADADPWGNTYLVGVSGFEGLDANSLPTYPVWIISAGPDGIIHTPIAAAVCYDGKSLDNGTTALGDDICIRIK